MADISTAQAFATDAVVSNDLSQWFLDIVRAEVRRRVKELLPCLPTPPTPPADDKIGSIKGSARWVVHHENPPLPTPEDIMASTLDVSAPALSHSVVLFGLQFRRPNKADGSPGDVVTPNESRVKVTAPDASVVTAVYSNSSPDGPNAVTLSPTTGAAEGATSVVTVSASETGTEDDFTINFSIGPMTIANIDSTAVTMVVHENAASPPVVVDPEPPVDPPVDPPIDPPPVDPPIDPPVDPTDPNNPNPGVTSRRR